MDSRLTVMDAHLSPLEVGGDRLEQPPLDELMWEIGVSEPLMSFVPEFDEASASSRPNAARALHPETLDPVIFAGLLSP